MRTEDGDGPVRHLVQLLDEAGALGLEALDHMAVVNDLVADIDRLPVLVERPLDDVNRPDHPRAEAARLCKNNAHFQTPVTLAPRPCRGPADHANPASVSGNFRFLATAFSPTAPPAAGHRESAWAEPANCCRGWQTWRFRWQDHENLSAAGAGATGTEHG